MPDVPDLLPGFKRYALLGKGMREATCRQTITLVDWLTEFANTTEVSDLNTDTIREFLCEGRATRAWSPKTFRLYRQYLKGFFAWCEKRGHIKENPVTAIEQPRLPKRLPRSLTKDQALNVLSHVRWHPWRYELEASRNEAIFAMFIYTGIRLGELLSLETASVNLDNSEIIILSGKGSKDRMLAIHPRLLSVLRGYERSRRRHGAVSRWYFPSVRSEKRLTTKNLYRIFDIVSRSAGIKVRPHMLRHTFGRLCVEANMNLRVVQSMMGHSNVSTTEIYTHVSTKVSGVGLHCTTQGH